MTYRRTISVVAACATAGGLSILATGAAQAAPSGSPQIAFQADTNRLWYYTPTNAGNRNTGLAMDSSGSSPSVAATGETAFQGANNHLWLYNPSTGASRDTGLGRELYTSPAIVSLTGGGYEIAFTADTRRLWLYNPS